MKRYPVFIVVFFGFILAPCSSMAQDNDFNESFSRMRQELLDEFEGFRKEINKEYADFLLESWLEFRLFKGEPYYERPKIVNPSIYNNTGKAEIEVETHVDKISVPEPADIKESPIEKELESVEKDDLPVQKVSYYGSILSLRYKSDIQQGLKSVRNDEISKLWHSLSGTEFPTLLLDMINNKESMQMNDWAYVQMVIKISDQLFSNHDKNSRTVFQHFMLVQSGYDARLGKNNQELVLLLPITEKVYRYSYLKIGDTRFYVINDGRMPETNTMLSFVLPEKLKGNKKISLRMDKPLLLPMKPHPYSLSADGIEIKGEVNINRMDFFSDYAPCALSIYANAVPEKSFSTNLLESFKSRIKDKTNVESLNLLISWVQHAFEYKTDTEQFGFEKPYFIEENFYYPFSDCEDRAILYAFLVRNLLSLKVVLLSYSDHVATAVCVPGDFKGDFLMIKNEKFIICDPTYISASIGQCMPQYKGKSVEVITLN